MIVTGVTALALSAAFIANARGIMYRQATARTEESVLALRDQLLARFGEWDALVRFTAAGAAELVGSGDFSSQSLQSLLARNFELQPDVNILYATSNARWDGPGGFAAFHNNWSPPPGWDNTERPWFLAAKASPGSGRVGYTAPFVDAMTQNLIISVVTNIYDAAGGDAGVVSTDVSLAFLNALLDEKALMPEHRLFLIDRQGRFITHPDPDAILARDFFGEFGLERHRARIIAEPSFVSHSGGAFVYSELIPGVNWILVSMIPSSAVFAEMNAFLLGMIAIVAALLVAAFLVSVWFARKELSVPISGIKSVADSLAGMDFAVDIKVTGNDEIGDMQGAMLKIRDNLKKGLADMQSSLESQKKMEVAVKERMQAMLDAAPMVCVVYDKNDNVVEVNKAAEDFFGIPDKNILARSFTDFLPERQPDGSNSLQKCGDVIKRAFRKGRIQYEWMYRRRDGTPLPTENTMTRMTVGGDDFLIAYSRDLREFYASKEAEQSAQKRVGEMTEKLNGQLEAQSAAITESSSAIEEMIANIQSVSGTLSKNAENVKELQEASEVGHSGLSAVAADIKAIAQESESLLEINAVMQNIASQTNLLSMNAAIEAAHAGASGLGFAVVADEIHKLAESSSRQSKTIRAALKKIKGSIDKITMSTDSVINKFDAIDGGVRTVAEQENGMLNAMAEQGAGSAQIMQAIAQVNDITHQVKEDARQMVEAAARLGV